MERVSSCPHGQALQEPHTGQRLILTSDDVSVYRLRENTDFWPGDRSPDGVAVGYYGGRTWVCFLEMKSSSKDSSHARSQLEMGVTHFAPSARCGGLRTHGDSHHDRWENGQDPLAILPDKTHCVAAVRVVWRHSARSPFKPVTVCGKKVRFVTVSLSMRRVDEMRLPFREFCKKATLPQGRC